MNDFDFMKLFLATCWINKSNNSIYSQYISAVMAMTYFFVVVDYKVPTW